MSLVESPRSIMPPDANQELIAASTIAFVGATNGTALDLGASYGKYTNPQVQLKISAIKSSVGDETYNFMLQQADDAAFTVNVENLGDTSTKYNSAVAGDLYWVINVDNTLQTNSVTRRYVRIVTTEGGTLPSVTLAAYLTAYN